jgi:hypothetical protein
LTLTSMELINGPIETRVLDLSPKSWASTCVVWPLALICQIRRHDEGQRKEIYYMAWERQSEHSAHFQPSLRLQTWALALNRQRIRRGDKTYALLNSPNHRGVLVVEWDLVDHYHSSFSLRVQERLLLLSSLEGSNLVLKSWLAFSRVQPHHYR